MLRSLLLAAAGLLLWGCAVHRPAPSALHPSYVVGSAYQTDGVWVYPREDFRLDTTGLAVVLPGRGGLTANGEASDPQAMAASHPTLQLPAIARVTNLETGLQILVRINDRGPPGINRLLGLSPGAGERLGMAPGGVARIRLQVESGPSQALRDGLSGGLGAMVAMAPRGEVTSESLAPPPGIGQSGRGRAAARAAQQATATNEAVDPEPLPEVATRVMATPGQLWIRAGEFGQISFARMVESQLAGLRPMIERAGQGRSQTFRVRAGPYADVAEADIALDRATRAGVTDARIVVE